jgi:hypothetical protein
MKNEILKTLFDVDLQGAIDKNVCISPPIGCGKPATIFRDRLSEKEYNISGLCQECQDKIFGS